MDDLLEQGITAYKAEKRDEARKIFIAVVKQSPDSESAWGWMYTASSNDKEQIHCLKQMLRINPKNEKAKQMLDALTGQDFPFDPPQKVTSPIQERIKNAPPIVQNGPPVAQAKRVAVLQNPPPKFNFQNPDWNTPELREVIRWITNVAMVIAIIAICFLCIAF